jgi:hypothetical protein
MPCPVNPDSLYFGYLPRPLLCMGEYVSYRVCTVPGICKVPLKLKAKLRLAAEMCRMPVLLRAHCSTPTASHFGRALMRLCIVHVKGQLQVSRRTAWKEEQSGKRKSLEKVPGCRSSHGPPGRMLVGHLEPWYPGLRTPAAEGLQLARSLESEIWRVFHST